LEGSTVVVPKDISRDLSEEVPGYSSPALEGRTVASSAVVIDLWIKCPVTY
jgi:hypothetical protein